MEEKAPTRIEYVTIVDDDRIDFDEAVTRRLNNGWSLAGGVAVTLTGDWGVYHQAMTREVTCEV